MNSLFKVLAICIVTVSIMPATAHHGEHHFHHHGAGPHHHCMKHHPHHKDHMHDFYHPRNCMKHPHNKLSRQHCKKHMPGPHGIHDINRHPQHPFFKKNSAYTLPDYPKAYAFLEVLLSKSKSRGS
ncbi:MAG: hypothetical protein LBI26_02985 [Holosporales bacterium]|nr:hypothetical protein [Holosporales bacterium]